MALPEEHKVSIIASGLRFMRDITEAYGSEEGLALWEKIASVLDPDVKGQIFFAMITGEYNTRITIRGTQRYADKVTLIKTIRNVDKRGIGFKEAKDMVELAVDGQNQIVEVEPTIYVSAVRELTNSGFIVV